MKPLKKREFVTALKKGQGRAFIQVKEYGLTKYKVEVLTACLENQNYDADWENSRATWLFTMFKDSSYYDEYRRAIIMQLREPFLWKSRMQLYELLGEMARDGDTKARKFLKKRAFHEAILSGEDESLCIESWKEIQTIDEFIPLVRVYGDWITDNPDKYLGIHLLPEIREQEFLNVIKMVATEDLSIKAYFDYIIKEMQPRERFSRTKRRQEFRKEHTLKQILQDAKQKRGEFPGRYRTFGRYATKKELQKIYEEIIKEKDSEVLFRLLWIFRGTPIPEVSEYVIQLARGKHKQVRASAIAALAQLKDKKIHQLAQELVAGKKIVAEYREALDLFIHNYESSDSTSIMSALQDIHPSIDDIHMLGSSLIDISDKQNDPALVRLLLWVYENTPCMQCRGRSLEELKKYDGIPKELWEEIEFDADESIRSFWKINHPQV